MEQRTYKVSVSIEGNIDDKASFTYKIDSKKDLGDILTKIFEKVKSVWEKKREKKDADIPF